MSNKKTKATFQDVSDWNEMLYYQTGGTRNKRIVQKPNTDDLYYFKTSLKKEKIDYKHEFWSEIIASKIGQQLGYHMLDYNIAYCNGEIGCLSKSMINSDEEELSEGIQYLMGADPLYNPSSKSSYDKYTFSFIEKALKEYKLEQKISDIIKTIIFDSIIGNSDRHQENWGFIVSKNNIDFKSRKLYNQLVDSRIFKFILRLQSPKTSPPNLIDKSKIIDSFLEQVKGKYTPIYDSGSCLGREIADDKVKQMLTDKNQLDRYVSKGTSEIRWEKDKISHYTLIENIKSRTKYSQIVQNELKRLSEVFNEQTIREIVTNIDNQLPEELIKYKLPDERKELIIKIVTLRFGKLQGLK